MKQALKCDFTWADFKTNSDGMVPVVVQDAENDEVLMLVSLSQSIRSCFTYCTWPELSPFVQSSLRLLLQYVIFPRRSVVSNASSFM